MRFMIKPKFVRILYAKMCVCDLENDLHQEGLG